MPKTNSCTTFDPLAAAGDLAADLDKALAQATDALPRPLRTVYEAFCDGDHLTDDEVAALLLYVRIIARMAAELGPTFRLFARQAIMDEHRLKSMLDARRRHQTSH